MKAILLAISSLSLLLAPALAGADVQLQSCRDAGVGIESLVSPIAGNSKSYFSGNVTVYNIDREEPAAASAGLAIVMSLREGSGVTCMAITGVSSIDINRAAVDHEPGLLLILPYRLYDRKSGQFRDSPVPLHLRIDLANETIALE